MAKRRAEGWTLGAVHDDAKKETPLLVPYDQLSEREKNTDRAVVNSVIAGIGREGWTLEPPDLNHATASADLAEWTRHLESQRPSIVGRGARSKDFDMDDRPEIAVPALKRFPVLRRALEFLSEHLTPVWRVKDAEAVRLLARHQWIARLAIGAGTLAIVAAIFQLVLGRVTPEPTSWGNYLMVVEVVSVLIAAFVVAIGFAYAFHHDWIASRNASERLRSLKFTALGDPDLWANPAIWEGKLLKEIAALKDLEFGKTKEWIEELGSPVPDPPRAPLGMSSNESQPLAAFVRLKRLEFQQRYFERRAAETERKAWFLRLHFPVVIFVASVVAVFAHVIAERVNHGHDVATWLIGIAAALPVFGLGLRASLAAFEIPRSRNLFRAKARALEHHIRRNAECAASPRRTLVHIARVESLFTAEHLEWCRLHVEAEWFV
jgi:hypothetical protein